MHNFGRAAPRDRNVVSSRRPHLSKQLRAGSTDIALPYPPLFATPWRFSQDAPPDNPPSFHYWTGGSVQGLSWNSTGRLSGRSGSGSFVRSDDCTGRWTASKQ